MKTAVISFTEGAFRLAEKISGDIEDARIFDNRELKVKDLIGDLFSEYDALVFVCACGIAVRLIAPYVSRKDSDPAVVVADEGAQFAISLLSGHLGGANELAKKVALIIGAIPVISTASDVHGIESIDVFAKKNGLVIDDIKRIAPVMARIVEGKKVGILNETNVKYECGSCYEYAKGTDFEAVLVISSRTDFEIDKPYCVLRPKNISVGIGCRRNTECSIIEKALESCLEFIGVSEKSICEISSIDLKSDERGIVELAKKLSVPFNTYTASELAEVEGVFQTSDFVLKTTGVDNVSGRAALFKGGTLLADKFIYEDVTVSVARREI